MIEIVFYDREKWLYWTGYKLFNKSFLRISSIYFILILKQTSINYYSDEQVEPCPEDEIVTENAYVLFYARRENKESNQNEVFSQS